MAYGYERQPMVEKPQFTSQANLYADRAGAGAPRQMYGTNGPGNPGGAYNASYTGYRNAATEQALRRRMGFLRDQWAANPPDLEPTGRQTFMSTYMNNARGGPNTQSPEQLYLQELNGNVGNINQQNPQGLGQSVGEDFLALLQGQMGGMNQGPTGVMSNLLGGLGTRYGTGPIGNNPFASPAGPSAAPGMLRPSFAKPGGPSGFTRPPRGY